MICLDITLSAVACTLRQPSYFQYHFMVMRSGKPTASLSQVLKALIVDSAGTTHLRL